jgi:uncharacterized metal-binding protein
MIVARVEEGLIVSRRSHSIKDLSEDALLDELAELGVDTLVCGGVDQDFIEDAGMCGIKVINNVAGEAETVLEELCRGRLLSGYGLDSGQAAPVPCPVRPVRPEVHCVRCVARVCLQGEACHLADIPTGEVFDTEKLKIAEVAADISEENNRQLCRVAELVHFALGMGYRRVGVAFCVELFPEAEILCGIFSRFFEVVPVCCRIGSAAEDRGGTGRPVSCCNVGGQAEILNERRTDLNVMVGLCVGCDIIFTGRSLAPATTLFVKDRSLANNPVGALYSRHYLETIVSETKPNTI